MYIFFIYTHLQKKIHIFILFVCLFFDHQSMLYLQLAPNTQTHTHPQRKRAFLYWKIVSIFCCCCCCCNQLIFSLFFLYLFDQSIDFDDYDNGSRTNFINKVLQVFSFGMHFYLARFGYRFFFDHMSKVIIIDYI